MIDLKQGDCLELMKDIPDKSVDAVVTDPPYEHVMGGMKSKKYNVGSWKADSYMNMKMSQFKHDDVFKFMDIVIPKMKKVNMYIFCSKLQLASYFDYLNKHKKLKFDLLIWDKSSKDGKYSLKSSKFYAQDLEYVVRIYQSGVSLNKVWNEDHTKADFSYYMKRQHYKQPRGLHESQKPTELLKKYLLASTNESETVLDPFMGSGSTGVAAVSLNRDFIGYELDQDYFEIATKRINEAIKDHE